MEENSQSSRRRIRSEIDAKTCKRLENTTETDECEPLQQVWRSEFDRTWIGGWGGKRSWCGVRDRRDHCRIGSCRECIADPKNGATRTPATKTVRLEAANGRLIRVEGEARLELVGDGKKCTMKFLDTNIKRLLASVSASVAEGHIVVFGQQESYIENASKARGFRWAGGKACLWCSWKHTRVRDRRRRWSLMRWTRIRFSGGEREPKYGRNFVNGVIRIKKMKARNEACVTRNEGLDDVAREDRRKHEVEEEFGKKEHHAQARSSTTEWAIIQHEMTHLLFRRWCRHCTKGRWREEDCRQSIVEDGSVADIHMYCMFMSDKKEGETLTFFDGKTTSDKSCAQHHVPEGNDGRMDIPKVDGMTAWDRIWGFWSTSWNRTTNRTSFDECDWARWERWRVDRGWSFRLV